MDALHGPLVLLLATRLVLGPGGDAEPGERQVSLEFSRWEALRTLAEAEFDPPRAPGPYVATRDVTLARSDEGLRITATWRIDAIEGGLWSSVLIAFPGSHPQSPPLASLHIESVRFRGRDIGIVDTPAGPQTVLELADRSSGTLELVAFVPSDALPEPSGPLALWLMPAVRGELRLRGFAAPEGQVAELVVASEAARPGQARRELEGSFWAGEAELLVQHVDASARSEGPEQPLALAQVAMGLTFGAGELRGRARASWLLRRGQLATVSLDTSGLGHDLELAGPNVLEWTRQGDRIDIVLKAAVDDRIDVDLHWTQSLSSEAEARVAAPRIAAGEAYRSESCLQIARDDDLELLPALAGWSTLASTELPEWASGYVQGSATASFRHERDDPGARFDVLRFVPVAGPPVMVDVAAYEIATTHEGRSLVQARYEVRNERASHLAIELPSDTRLLGASVDGEAVSPSRELGSAGTTTWRVPLERSLESVAGSLSFPVEIIYLGEGPAWAKQEQRELELPALDAPVAVSRVTVHLPPNYRNRVDVGDHHRVAAFSEGEGITYGLGSAADPSTLAQADQLYRAAVDGWMANDFEGAQSSLDELARLGAANENIAGLQANLDLVQGRGEKNTEDSSGQSAVVSRRIKDQAKTRASNERYELREKAEEAEALEAKGDYEQAEQKLAEAQAIGERLALLEQDESKEQVAYNQSLSSSSARVAQKKKQKAGREQAGWKSDEQRFSIDGKARNDDDRATVAVLDPAGTPAKPNEPQVVDGLNVDATVTETTVTGTSTSAAISIDYESLTELPVATESRDFVSVVQVMPGVAGRGKRGRPGKQAKADKRGTKAPDAMPTPPLADPNAALAGPIATAAAVTLHVPAIGETVTYQYMLQPEGKAPTVHLDARRHKRRSKP